ncbi:Transketolase [Conglomerata obtusa]
MKDPKDNIEKEFIYIRRLQALIGDIVNDAKSGHPGSAISLVPFFYTLYRHVRFDPNDCNWADRDIVIMSNGHACLVQYTFLHLIGFISYDDLVSYRKIGSKTPGHPENFTDGIEVCTGPLGQGLANAVGFGISQLKIKAIFNKEFDDIERHVDSESCTNLQKNHNEKEVGINSDVKRKKRHDINSIISEDNINNDNKEHLSLLKSATICIFGDGCYQEGISHESFSLASLYNPNIIYVYDSNEITIDGSTKMSMRDCPTTRFKSYGFTVIEVDGNDIVKIDKILSEKLNNIRKNIENGVLMIILKTKIACGTLLEGNAKAHGSPLGIEVLDKFREEHNLKGKKGIGNEIYQIFEDIKKKNLTERNVWNEEMKLFYDKRDKLKNDLEHCDNINSDIIEKQNKNDNNILNNTISLDSDSKCKYLPDLRKSRRFYYEIDSDKLNEICNIYSKEDEKVATRKHLENALNDFNSCMPFLMAGCADLTPSCLTKSKESTEFTFDNPYGNYIRYGIREAGMFGAMSGIAAHGFFLPLGGTFLNFTTYGFHGIRLACLAKFKVIYIATHDSIGLGEDGPTHQPIETLALFRSTPGLVTIRPCDGIETRFALKYAIERNGPTILSLSRQNIPKILNTSFELCKKGGYLVYEKSKDITIVATGSEVSLAIEVAKVLGNANVVSLLSFEIFDEQEQEYKDSILTGFKISLEALSTFGWNKYCDYCIGMSKFGISGDTNDVYSHFGFSVNKIVENIKDAFVNNKLHKNEK